MMLRRKASRPARFRGGVVAVLSLAAAALIFWIISAPSRAVYAQQEQPGGGVIPIRQVSDPYPVFNGIAIDPENSLVAMSDVNRKSLLSYSRLAESRRGGITDPLHHVFGPATNVGFV